jgi:nucleoside-diphosphate-sugar epimerase
MYWTSRRVLVTGGASFIGSALADVLIEHGARVRVVDDLTSGRLEDIQEHLAKGRLEFIQADLREPGVTRAAMQGIQTVFHLADEKIDDGTAVNLGTMERIRVIDAVKMVMEFTGHKAESKLLKNMPTGPLNRVADNTLANKLLGWKPKVPFREGLRRTIDWYYKTKDRQQVQKFSTGC